MLLVTIDVQKVERRDRNREHAQKSRLRKKSVLKSLQLSLEALHDQNTQLRKGYIAFPSIDICILV